MSEQTVYTGLYPLALEVSQRLELNEFESSIFIRKVNEALDYLVSTRSTKVLSVGVYRPTFSNVNGFESVKVEVSLPNTPGSAFVYFDKSGGSMETMDRDKVCQTSDDMQLMLL